MNSFRLTLFITLGLFFIGCGEEDSTPTVVESATDTVTLKIDIGEDKRVKINESLTINAKEIPNNENVSSYLWKYKEKTLATTRAFSYTPTNLGVDILDFSVLYNDGLEVSDSINIIVTTKELNIVIPAISDTLKREYLAAINTARASTQNCQSRGDFAATSALSWENNLYKASYEHSQDLIASKTFAHEGSGTESDWAGYALSKSSDLVDRSEAYGYEWSRLGENLAGGTNINTAQEAVNSWLESGSHCANLMNPNFTEVGMAMVKNDDSVYVHYWSQNFGAPK